MSHKDPKISSKAALGGLAGFSFLNILLFCDLFWSKGQVLSSPQADLYLHFVAWRQFGFDQLRQGHLVLWNPHYLCGAPFLGNFESALLYPPNWLYLILPLSTAINVGIILHVILAGFFVYLWGLQRGYQPLGAFVAGTIFMWGGAYFLHLFAGHLPNLSAMVWAPLIFMCVEAFAQKISIRWILLGVFAVSMQILAGHPQYVYFTAIIALIYSGVNLLEAKNKVGFGASLAIIYLGAGLLTAAQLWTGIEAFNECGRNIPLEIKSASSFSLPPENVLTLFLPNFFGDLGSGHYWGRWYLWEVSLFMGAGGLFLCFFGFMTAKFREVRWILIPALVAFVLALGPSTPLYNFLYNWVPFFKGIRGICKFDFILLLFLAMSAGLGMSRLVQGSKHTQRAFFSCLFMGGLLLTMSLLIHISLSHGLSGVWFRWFTSIHWLANTAAQMELGQRLAYSLQAGANAARSLVIGGISFLVLALLLGFRERNPKVTYGIAIMCILELLFFARDNRPTFNLSQLQKKFDALGDFYSKNPGEYRVYGTASSSLVTGGHDIWEDEPMVLGRYGRFVCFSQGLSENQLFSQAPIFQRFPPQLGMLRLKYRIFMDEAPIRITPFLFKTLPRMLLVDQWEAVPDGTKILPFLFDSKFDPSRKILLEKAPAFTPSQENGSGKVEWKDLSTDDVLINVNTPKDCILLITDNYSRGWQAMGSPEEGSPHYEVIPADYFLMGIPLKTGKHHFLLEYRPLGFEIGKWVSLFSCTIYFALVYLAFRRKSFFP